MKKSILQWAWAGFRAGVAAAFVAGIALHAVMLLFFRHLFVSYGDFVIPPLLYAAHLTLILGVFGLVAGVFWGIVFALRRAGADPGKRNALCAATCIPAAAGFFALLWIGIDVFPDLDSSTLASGLGIFAGCLLLLLVLSRSTFAPAMRSAVPPTGPAIALVVIVATTCVLGHRLSVEHMCARPQEIIPRAEQMTETAGRDKPNVLLITVDTMRADHLGCYGYPWVTSPVVDSLAARGVLVKRAYAQRPKTSPSFATIHTGTYPQRHGVRGVRQVLPGSAYTLAESLHDLGYKTCGVVTNGNLFPAFRFNQGFDEYFFGHSIAEEGTDIARRWLLEGGDAPFFLWVHHTDPHTPYTPPPPYDRLFVSEGGPEDESLKTIKRRALGGVLPNKIIDGPLDLDYYISQYDGEVAYTDHHVGELLSTLRELGLAENTLVVFTSDHGESLGDHNYYFQHGLFAYEQSSRIPLVFCLPGSLAASVEDRILFESVDIMPTIIGLLGAQPPASCQGESRAARLKGAESYADGGGGSAYIEAGYSHYYGPGLTFALVKGRYKFVARDSRWTIRPRHVKEFLQSLVAFLETGAASNELYDIESDPEERNNLIDELPAVAASLKTELSSTLARLENAGRIPVDQDRSDLDEQTLKSLKALGYIQ